MDEFGDNLYNLYGSTEVAWATIATPEDLRAAPGTAGRPPRGTVVRIVDEDGKRRCRRGDRPHLRRQRDGLRGLHRRRRQGARSTGCCSSATSATSTSDGRLFIDGRDDEMIVSGGENVFPREVEDPAADHEAVGEAAVIGVDDEQFGQRLKAFVVRTPGARAVGGPAWRATGARPRPLQGAARGRVFDESPRNATGKVLRRKLKEVSMPSSFTAHLKTDRRENRVADRAALITGGSSGIGLAVARALGQDGYG